MKSYHALVASAKLNAQLFVMSGMTDIAQQARSEVVTFVTTGLVE